MGKVMFLHKTAITINCNKTPAPYNLCRGLSANNTWDSHFACNNSCMAQTAPLVGYYADNIAEELFDIYYDILNGRPNTKGGKYRVNLLPTTVHIYFGSVIGALPNGRNASEPVSEGISPTQGADIKGPTAVVKSAAKLDHARTGGTLLNMKFTQQTLAGDAIDKLAHLIRAYFRMNGHHMQFNVVNAETLRKAQENPHQYRDLIVRVAGYSDYFIDVGRDLQNEIISRTQHQFFQD